MVQALGLQFENQVRRALKQIGLRNVKGGPSFRIGGHQIDAVGSWDDMLIVVECVQTSQTTASIRDEITNLKGKMTNLRRGFRSLDQYAGLRIEFALATRNFTYTNEHKELARRDRIHLLDWQVIDYYQRLAHTITSRGAVFNFLGELKIEPHDLQMPSVSAMRVQVSKQYHGYLFWMDPHELMKIAYVARRESGQEYFYQRALSGERINKIGGFIQNGGVFPNNVIIAFDSPPQFHMSSKREDSQPPWLDLGELTFPKSYRSAWIIDGQHRLYAFGKMQPNSTRQKLAVFAFERLSTEKQAEFFININHEQRRVSEDLIWDLQGEMRPQSSEGIIANCAKSLNSAGVLSGRIQIPHSGRGQRGGLKLSGVCQEIQAAGLTKNNIQITKQHQSINPLLRSVRIEAIASRVAQSLSRFLASVSQHAGTRVWDGILCLPGGFMISAHVFQQVLVRIDRVPGEADCEKYGAAFANILRRRAPTDDAIKDLKRDLTSYAQRRDVLHEILDEMQSELSDPEFAKIRLPAGRWHERLSKLERRLAEFVCEKIGVSTFDDLRSKAPEGVWRSVEQSTKEIRQGNPKYQVHSSLGFGQIKQLLERKDNAPLVMPALTDSSAGGFTNRDEVMVALAAIVALRNPMAHGRRAGNRTLVTAYVQTFERVIG